MNNNCPNCGSFGDDLVFSFYYSNSSCQNYRESNKPEGNIVSNSCSVEIREPECKVDQWGIKRWYRNGLFHRDDRPAIEWASGTKE